VIESKSGQRLAGVVFLAGGVGFTIWSWHDALTEGYYYPRMAAFFPAFAVVGLGMVLFLIDRDCLRAEHGVDRPRSLAHYPLEWKILFVVALAAGLGNWYLLAQQ
jgi:hypothetical protein